MTLAPFWLPAIAEGFLLPNPGLTARLEEGDAAELQRRLLDHAVEASPHELKHTLRDIRRGEELTYDYCTDGAAGIKCLCRPGCRTTL